MGTLWQLLEDPFRAVYAIDMDPLCIMGIVGNDIFVVGIGSAIDLIGAT